MFQPIVRCCFFANRKIISPQISERGYCIQYAKIRRSIKHPTVEIPHSCVLRSLEEPTAGLFIDSSLHDVAHAMPEDWHYVQVGTRDLNAASASVRIRVNVYPFTYDHTKHYHREANKPSRACICKTVF